MKRTIADVLRDETPLPGDGNSRQEQREPHISEDLIVNTVCGSGFVSLQKQFQLRGLSREMRHLFDSKYEREYPNYLVQINLHHWSNFSSNHVPARRDQIVVHCSDEAVQIDSIQAAASSNPSTQFLFKNRRLPSIAALKPKRLSIRAWSVPKGRERQDAYPPYRGVVGTDTIDALAKQAGDSIETLYLASLLPHRQHSHPSLSAVFRKFSKLTKLCLHSYMDLSQLITAVVQLKTLRHLLLHVNSRNVPPETVSDPMATSPLFRSLTTLNELPQLEQLEIFPVSMRTVACFRSPLNTITRLTKLNVVHTDFFRVDSVLRDLPCLEELGTLIIDGCPHKEDDEQRSHYLQQQSQRPASTSLRKLSVLLYDERKDRTGYQVALLLELCRSSFPNLQTLQTQMESRPQSRMRTLTRWIMASWKNSNVRTLSALPALSQLNVAVTNHDYDAIMSRRLDRKMERVVERLNETTTKQVVKVPCLVQSAARIPKSGGKLWLPMKTGHFEPDAVPEHPYRGRDTWAMPVVRVRGWLLDSSYLSDSELDDSDTKSVDSDTVVSSSERAARRRRDAMLLRLPAPLGSDDSDTTAPFPQEQENEDNN